MHISGVDQVADSPEALNLFELRKSIWAAMDDIREHLQVAKYNLRGEVLGEFVGIPERPQLIHEQGIAQSEATIEMLRLTSCKITAAIKREGRE